MSCDNYEYFIKNRNALAQKYNRWFLVIKDCRVIGSYDTFDEAFTETTKTEELGTFLIQDLRDDGENTNTHYFYSNNVAFV